MSTQGSSSFPFPFIVASQQGGNNLLENDAPARVKTALDFLQQLIIKTMPRAAASDNQIEWAPETKLNANEVAAQGAACNLLVKYFSGDLKADSWEEVRRKAAKEGMLPTRTCGTLMRCFGCAPDYTGECHICDGKRTVLVYPSGN
ncbi:hypothetical protein C4577_03495 [Candidatus Parcubacteria bacterium]|nr:MAG: hypothetical protein C4577_03495 [Candidatus Parcubacteria bacterium]